MRKGFIKIICVLTAAISAFGVSFLTACGDSYTSSPLSGDTSGEVSSNGGFLVEKGDYVYFINGAEDYTADNTYGDVLKGSIQRISSSDLAAGNYTNTQTVVPLIVYSGNSDAGIYIYGDYIYYATPNTAKNSDGVIQNQYLDFKRSKLDGSETMKDKFYQASDNSVAYRYVEVDGTVYLLYALSENLYGSSTTNIHSLNTATGDDILLAYNVGSYTFDSADLENPYVYYTMSVTVNLGTDNAVSESYNQLYRVKADVTSSPREYDFSDVEDYDSSDNPLYINYGDFVYDGIGIFENGTADDNRISQFNYNYGSDKQYAVTNTQYTYALNYYKEGVLSYIRSYSVGDQSISCVYTVSDSEIDGAEEWDAIERNGDEYVNLVLSESDTTEYYFITLNGEEKVVYSSSSGIMIGEIVKNDGVNTLENEYCIASASSPTVLKIAEERTLKTDSETETETRLYIYYMLSGGGIYRVAADSAPVTELSPDGTDKYNSVQILDISADTSWYLPEFVGNTIVFLSTSAGMSGFDYLMACDLTGANGTDIMSQQELYDYKEKMDGVFDLIDDTYGDEDLEAYDSSLVSALKYLFYTGDSGYMQKLVTAYEEIEDTEDAYSEAALAAYAEYAELGGIWADYAEDYKQVNGETVYATSQEYYYSLLGRMTSSDKEDLADSYKSSYMLSYPEEEELTWWEGLNTAAKVCFIIGMVLAGLLVLGGIAVLVLVLIRRRKRGKEEDGGGRYDIDITDDRDIDVYADDNVRSLDGEGTE